MLLKRILADWVDEHELLRSFAEKLGVEYAGYGRWKDKHSGKIIAKTVGDRIIAISGVSGDAMESPAEAPASMTAEPIQGDSMGGNDGMDSTHDAYQDTIDPTATQYRGHTLY